MGSNAGTKQQQHDSSVVIHSSPKERGVENGLHHQSSTFSTSSIENSRHERKKRPSGSTLAPSSTCNQLVTSSDTKTNSRNTSPSSQSSQSSNSSSSSSFSPSSNGNNRINVTSPSPRFSSNKKTFQNLEGRNQIGIKNAIGSHSNRFTSSPGYGSSNKTGGYRPLTNCSSLELSEQSWNSSNRQEQEMCGRVGVGAGGGSLTSLLNPISKKQLQDPFYRPFVS